MAKASDFQTHILQAIAIAGEPEAFQPSAILASLLKRFAARFDGPVQALPIPREAPPELPRIVLQSATGEWRLEAGPQKLTVTWYRRIVGPEGDSPEALDACLEVIQHYNKFCRTDVRRLGLVLTRGAETDDPATELTARFCSDFARNGPFRRSQTFELHNHKQFQLLPDVPVNSWVRCKTGFVANDPQRRAIVVEQDLNTLGEDAIRRKFTPSAVAKFFATADEEASKILSMYFSD